MVNPWMEAATEVVAGREPAPAVPVERPRVRAHPCPPVAVQPLEPGARLPRRAVKPGPMVWVLGVHGGAGESTVARCLPESAAAGHAWPVREDAGPVSVLLVARSSTAGLRAVQRAMRDWASHGVPGVEISGLVLIPDAPGKRPRPLREFVELIRGAVPAVWEVPWCEAWRFEEEPSMVTATAGVGRAIQGLIDDVYPTTNGS